MGVRAFPPGELVRLRGVQESAMQDEGQLLTYTAGTANAFGLDAETYAGGRRWACGFRPVARQESMNETQVGERLAEVRFPLQAETELATANRFKLLRRFGELITPLTFEIVGLPERGPSGLVIRLKQVTDGSDE